MFLGGNSGSWNGIFVARVVRRSQTILLVAVVVGNVQIVLSRAVHDLHDATTTSLLRHFISTSLLLLLLLSGTSMS